MKIDLHTHAKWSMSTNFSFDYYQDMMRAAHRNDLDAVALTEHFHTHQFYDIYNTLERKSRYFGNHYVVEGVKVFPGMEVDVMEGGHILIIGEIKAIIAIRERLEEHTVHGSYVRLEQLLSWSEAHACLSIGAHPFREVNPLYRIKPELLARLDGFDVNGRDLYHYGSEMEGRVQKMAEKIELPVVGGSDTHHPLQFGSVYNEFEQDCDMVEQLRSAIRRNAFKYRISPEIDSKVQLAEKEQARYKRARSAN